MKLSDGEKLILTALCELYKHGKVKGEIDPEFVKRTIHNEQTWAFHWKYRGIPFESTDTPPLVHEVSDILDMWWLIESAYDKPAPPTGSSAREGSRSLGKPQLSGVRRKQ